MKVFGRFGAALPLAAAVLLSACGGGGGVASPAPQLSQPGNQQAGQGIAVGEPTPGTTPPERAKFIDMARNSACSEARNRLFVIDQKYVLWDHAGDCADMSYGRQLYGATPAALLCTSGDTIAGPRTSCADASVSGMFDTILQHLDKADLGLGSGHKVEALAFLPKDGASVPLANLAQESFSGVKAARNVVIKDEAAFAALWAEHNGNRERAQPLPKVDFTRQMVLGVFAGETGACREFGITNVSVNKDKIAVNYEDRDINPVTICIAVVMSPMHLVTIDRSDAAVEFVAIKPVHLGLREIENSNRSNIQTAQTHVIRDAQAWARLWTAHKGDGAKLPEVDFNKDMVVAVFLGSRPNGCYSTGLSDPYLAGGKIYISNVEYQPGENLMCTMALVHPASLVLLPRSEDPVVFSFQVSILK